MDEWASEPITGVVNPPAGIHDLTMDVDIKLAWCDALESGEYPQTFKGRMRTIADEYCPLGVLCDLAAKAKIVAWDHRGEDDYYMVDGYYNILPLSVKDWAGIKRPVEWDGQDVPLHFAGDWQPIWRLNDRYKMPLDRIGQMIRMQY